MNQEIRTYDEFPDQQGVVVCNEVPEPGTAGETDRCWALAEALSANHDVILALPKLSGLPMAVLLSSIIIPQYRHGGPRL